MTNDISLKEQHGSMTLYTGLLVCIIASIASVAIDLASYGRVAAYIERELSLYNEDLPGRRSHHV